MNVDNIWIAKHQRIPEVRGGVFWDKSKMYLGTHLCRYERLTKHFSVITLDVALLCFMFVFFGGGVGFFVCVSFCCSCCFFLAEYWIILLFGHKLNDIRLRGGNDYKTWS